MTNPKSATGPNDGVPEADKEKRNKHDGRDEHGVRLPMRSVAARRPSGFGILSCSGNSWFHHEEIREWC